MGDFSERQQMLCLSYITYAGYYRLEGAGEALAIGAEVDDWLERVPATAGVWKRVWGPATSRFPGAIFDDNMVFVAQHGHQPHRFAVCIRGTNPISVSNWLLEDFLVVGQKSWPHGDAPPAARISMGTHLGLSALSKLRAGGDSPGAWTTVAEFLGQQAARSSQPLEVAVTGHSLGGALAPAFALYLHDTREAWSPRGAVTLSTYAFGGPSPGNGAFARYFDTRLGERCDRVSNSLDPVPHTWTPANISEISGLYEPDAKLPWLLAGAARFYGICLKKHDYTHVRADQPWLKGKLAAEPWGAVPQMIYQHVVAYPELLGVELPRIEGASLVPHHLFEGAGRWFEHVQVGRVSSAARAVTRPVARFLDGIENTVSGRRASVRSRDTAQESVDRPEVRLS